MINWKLKIRRLHQATVWWASLFLIISTITGLLWAYAPYLYWHAGYKKIKRPQTIVNLTSAQVSQADLLHSVLQKFGEDVIPTEVTLTNDGNLLLYRVRFTELTGRSQQILVDADKGEWLSPLSRENAIRFARQYVKEGSEVIAAAFVEKWLPRKSRSTRPAWQVTFNDQQQTQIFIDPSTGAILEDMDNIRQFHFFIMKLHQFNFFGFNKTLTIIPGFLLLFMIATGIYLRLASNSRKNKRLFAGRLSP